MDVIVSVMLMGLLGGVHCLGMCGGVVGLLSANIAPGAKTSAAQSARLHLGYNLGRILSYVLMGALFGLLGTLLAHTLQMSTFDNILRLFSGVLMIFVGLYIGAWSGAIQVLERLGAKLWRHLQPLSMRFMPVSSVKRAFLVGVLWGGIPCGLVYGALSFAMLSGSVAEGALIMLAFGLGTLPALLLMASMAEKLSQFVKQPWVRKFSGVVIILLGLNAAWMPTKALILSGTSLDESYLQQPIYHSDYDNLV